MYNQNFYNNLANNFTFQSTPISVPPPPPPPPFFLTPFNNTTANTCQKSDEDVLKEYEQKIPMVHTKMITKTALISEFKEKLRTLVFTLNILQEKRKILTETMISLSNEEWKKNVEDIETSKSKLTELMDQISGADLETLRKYLAKRSAKRLRLKRVRKERKVEKEQRRKEMEEKSRKIDENLQKIKDDINRAKQEEESKIQADIVLKEVLRRKNDARKCITKLDALIKLRRARQNTAKGRGASVSEKEADTFNKNIEKLKSLWVQKLAIYDKEESDLRAKLKQDATDQDTEANKKEKETIENLAKWREFLFGDRNGAPQVNFNGDIERFVAVRSQWDKFIDDHGSPLPIGWVTPQSQNNSSEYTSK